VLAHGFTQTARSWAVVERLLRDRRTELETIAVDLPGHGASTPHTGDLWAAADHLVERGGTGTYVGYSMGGRVCLHAALTHPAEVERLVLIGATPGIEDDGERRQRRTADEALADRIESIGVEAFLVEWLANPLFAGLSDDAADVADRRRNTASGLASSLRAAGTGTQDPLWDDLGAIERPVLLLVGERDVKFTAIAERMDAMLPTSDLCVIPNAGHSVHLEQPEATVAALLDWLDQRAD
jgi:2-succinyl-6-hydroxy-2,4-cyclohexadiene-1-carboxylate synthase